MRSADEAWRHHQPSAARRSHGPYPFAGQYLDRAVAEGQAAAEAGALGIDGEHGEVVSHKKWGRPNQRFNRLTKNACVRAMGQYHTRQSSPLPSVLVEPRSFRS